MLFRNAFMLFAVYALANSIFKILEAAYVRLCPEKIQVRVSQFRSQFGESFSARLSLGSSKDKRETETAA
jgi:hypothetical protein